MKIVDSHRAPASGELSPAQARSAERVKPALRPGSVEAAQLQLLAQRDQAAIRPALAGIALIAISQLGSAPSGLLALVLLVRMSALYHNHRVSSRVLALGAAEALGLGLLGRLEKGMLASGISWGAFAWLPPEPLNAASRVMTQQALNMIKSIAMGEYKPVEEKAIEEEVVEAESAPVESEQEKPAE